LEEKQRNLEIEEALTGLVKLMKALRFYPEGHPSLQKAIDESSATLQPMLRHQDNRPLQINQSGFSLGDNRIGETNPALPDLARLLAERRVNRLIFLPDLNTQELRVLLEGLSTPAEEIYSSGGLPRYLHERQVKTIWLNESSLEEALKKREEQENEAEEAEPAEEDFLPNQVELERSDLAQQLREIIDLLNTELQDDAYKTQLDKLLHLAPNYFEKTGSPAILRILTLLLSHHQQQDRSTAQRNLANKAIEHLLTEQIATQLLNQFRHQTLSPQQFQRLQKVIVLLGTRIAPFLLNEMASEEDSAIRKHFAMLLGKMGEPLLDLLRETVHSNKWFVARNAVALLGDLRLETGIPILASLTRHEDQRVRRALIRSLAMIGGDKAVEPLSQLTNDPTAGLRRPAVKALGATKSAAAVQPLLAIAQRFDPLARQVDIRRDAVEALGMLGDQAAIQPLLVQARRPNLLRLRSLEELRAEIILTLSKLGGEQLETELEKWRHSPHGTVQRAAEQSLANLTKKFDDPATD